MGCLAGGEHVCVVGQAVLDHALFDTLGDGGQIVRLRVQWA